MSKKTREANKAKEEKRNKKIAITLGTFLGVGIVSLGSLAVNYLLRGNSEVEGSTPVKTQTELVIPSSSDSSNTPSVTHKDLPEKQYASLEEMMTDFKEVPGQKEFHFTPGAKYTLVHLRQIHYHPVLKDLPLEEKIDLYKNMLQIHKEILETIKQLKTLGYGDVYLEGFSTEGDMQKVRVRLSDIEKNMSIYTKAYEKDVALNGNSSEKIRNSISKTLDSIFSEIHGIYIADSKVSGYSVKPAELKQMHNMALSTGAGSYDPREDVVLQKISLEDRKTMLVVIFGGDHDWVNNVNGFNKLPMGRGKTGNFNYIKITPPSYKD